MLNTLGLCGRSVAAARLSLLLVRRCFSPSADVATGPGRRGHRARHTGLVLAICCCCPSVPASRPALFLVRCWCSLVGDTLRNSVVR